MRYLKNIICLFCFLTAILHNYQAYGQTTIDSLLEEGFNTKIQRFSELIYIQTSKGIYETGEDLWFKAYQLSAQTMAFSSLSRTLYVQLFTESDSIVWQEKYPIEYGIAEGHVYLDERLPDGDYYLEAYTRHSFYKDSTQLNGIRKIRIQKNIAHRKEYVTEKDTSFRFDFFPEGGHLVAGIPSSLSFKSTDGKGNPVDISGALYEDGIPLAEIKTVHAGMGSVLFVPMSEKRYSVELENGRWYELPAVQAEGVSLRFAGQDKETIEFMVSQTGKSPQIVYLAGQIRGMVCCVAKGLLRDSLTIKMPLQEFPMQGIAEFTLFDSNFIPVAERLVYVHSDKKLYITAEPDKKKYELREKGTVNIKVTDAEGNPVKAHLGVSIYDQLYTNPADPVSILTHCYLSSQVRGEVYDPAYYFNEENSDRLEALDLLLQTQGWRCYTWNRENLFLQQTAILTDEVTGILTIKDKKVKGTEQLVQVSGAEGDSELVWADSMGYFVISSEQLMSLRDGYIYLKPMLTKNFGPKLKIDDPFPVISTNREEKERYYPYIDLTQIKKEQILRLPMVSRDSVIQLDEVSITAKTRRPFRDKFMGKLDSLAQMNLGPWVCEHGWLENYKEGYTHHHDPRYCPCPEDAKERKAPVIGKKYHIMKAEYFPCKARGGCCFKPIDHQWIIYEGALYTEEELLRMNNLWRTKGYYAVREFYQPDEVDMQLSIPDPRNTLLWIPSVITDEKGEASVSFYCSDINTGFTGRIEGTDGSGLLGSAECEFRVIRNIQ